ncbi:MAG: BadM/Rrf2 family transcriptional regulator [Alcaligenaceae bacterium]|nr:MAG: BadM/Rrf2 family transcriptional regulator [Alcaligenaceae bacterium]
MLLPASGDVRTEDAQRLRSFTREADMLEPLLVGIPAVMPSGMGEPFFEVQTLRGVVDLLFARINKQVIRTRSKHQLPALIELPAVAVMLALTELGAIEGTGGPAHASDIAPRSSVSVGHLRRTVLPKLVESGWVRAEGKGWVACQAYQVPVSAMTAVEIKRGDWRRALSQAIAHRDFADTYVALDRGRFTRPGSAAQAFEYTGVGLLTVNADDAVERRVERIIAARRTRRQVLPQAVVAERVIALIEAGRHSGDVPPVFGRFLTTTSGTDPRFR